MTNAPKGRTPWRTLSYALIPVLVVMLAVGARMLWQGSDAGTATSSPLAEPAATAADGSVVDLATVSRSDLKEGRVDVFLDGWSHRIIGGAATRFIVDGKVSPTPTDFEPVTRDDVAELLRTSPGLVADVLSRQVSGEARVSCTAAGCTVAGNYVDAVGLITAPRDVPGLGSSYAAWDIGSLLYRTSIVAPGNGEVVLQVRGFGGWAAPVVPALLEGSTEPDRNNGWLTNRYLVGAAFGRLFTVTPAWTADTPARYAPSIPQAMLTPEQADSPRNLATAMHLDGLDQPWVGAKGLSASALTYLSSPTGGCEVGVMCTPTTIDYSIASAEHEQALVCTTVGDREVAGWAVYDSAVVTADFDKATHQFGMWGGKVPADFKTPGGQGLLGGSMGPLVEGEQTARWGTLGIFDPVTGDLRAVAGSFQPSSAVGETLFGLLGGVNVDGNSWHSC